MGTLATILLSEVELKIVTMTYPLPLKTLFFLFIVIPVLCWPQTGQAQDSIHASQVVPFLDALHETLVYHHPFTQHEEGKLIVMDALVEAKTQWRKDSLEFRIKDSLIAADFFPYAANLQAALGCGHTILEGKTSEEREAALNKRQRRIPLIETISGKFVLTDTLKYGILSIPQGTEVLALDGHPIKELISKLTYFQGFNDANYRGGQLRYGGLALSWLYLNRYGIRDSVELSVLKDGKPRTYSVSLLYEPPKVELPKKARHQNRFKLTPLANGDGWRLRIASFSDRYYKGKEFNKLLREAFATIKASGKQKLVIDLRNNGGGNLNRVTELFTYLATDPFVRLADIHSYSPDARPRNIWNGIGLFLVGGVRKKEGRYHRPAMQRSVKPKPMAKRFSGEVVVIINEMTFSAATLMAHWFKQHERGLIVGRTSGGGSAVAYGGSTHRYPISDRFMLSLPNYRLDFPNPVPGNLQPHYEVRYAQEDIINNRDTQLAKAMELLKLEE